MYNLLWTFAQAGDNLDKTVEQSKNVFRQITDTIFNTQSIVSFVIALALALLLGRLAAFVVRRFVHILSRRIDKTQDLAIVNKLRRTETLLVLSIALIRVALVLIALYFWWLFNHPGRQSSGLIAAGTLLALLLAGVLGPVLRDLAQGSAMMAEHWYGVGDHITIDPLDKAQGVVERVTLRSTKIRGVNGEIIWISNQNIMGVRVAPRGVRTEALEIFVNDPDAGIKLIEETNVRLPIGPLEVVSPFTVMTQAKLANNLWHITAIAEVAPGREWLIDDFATKILGEIDEKRKQPILVHTPVTRYADSEAERRFARAIYNARKHRVKRQSVVKKVASKRKKLQNKKTASTDTPAKKR